MANISDRNSPSASAPAPFDTSERIIYDQVTGNLWYNADGLGGPVQLLVAVLSNKPVLGCRRYLYLPTLQFGRQPPPPFAKPFRAR